MVKDINGKPSSRKLLVAVLLIGIFCAVLNQTLLFTAQPTLMHVFHIGASTVQWLSTIYPLVVGVLMPITAWMADNINTKTLMLTAYGIFFIGTLCCTIAGSFSFLLVGRIIQAIGGGMIQGITMTVLFNIYNSEERGTITSLMGLAFGLAPAIGPTLSGWLIQISSWRLVFGVLLPFELITFLLGMVALKRVIPSRPSKLDWVSVIVSTIGFTALLYGLSLAGSVGWFASTVISFGVVGIIFVVWFCHRQTKIANPMLNLTPFKTFQYTLSLGIYAIAQMVMTGVQFLLPMYLQDIHLLTPMQSGMTLIIGALAMGLMSPISGYLINHGYGRAGIISGAGLLTVSVAVFTTISTTTSVILIALIYAVLNIGIALVSMPAQTVAINALPNSLISHGNAAMSMVRQIATSLGLSVIVSVEQTVIKAQNGHTLVDQLTGYHAAFLLSAILGAIVFVIAFRIKKPHREPITEN
ncbi:DHA2 family efflux MFS transporter permease subunit [Secundilactobacillus paracollinoides]|uniref:DHA2 family efflux MFS transporter permease subunit n=1 Tax=Secundilactobacillus paracollinoides TaxID=240427 RepID=UPI003F47D0A4